MDLCKIWEKQSEGYMTVEATLVFSISLGVILYIIFGMFFVYDRCLMDQEAGMLVLRGSGRNELSKKETAKYLLEENEKLSEGKIYVAWQEGDTEVTLKRDKVYVTKQGKLLFDAMFDWEGKSVATATRMNPPFFIRNFEKILEYGGQNSGDGIR